MARPICDAKGRRERFTIRGMTKRVLFGLCAAMAVMWVRIPVAQGEDRTLLP
jgi:hypothetical protein